MAKHNKKVKAKTDYLNRFREIRKFSNFNFEKDLRKTRKDGDFSPSEKAAITKIWNDYEPIRENVQNGSAQIVKPRKHKAESQTKYKKRLREIRKNTNPDFKNAPFVVAFVPKGTKIRFDKNNQMKTRRKNNSLDEYVYPLSKQDRLDLVFDPLMILQDKMVEHFEKHPRKPPLAVGFATNGFPWELVGVAKYRELAEMFLKKQNDYREQDDSLEIASFVTGIIIRA